MKPDEKTFTVKLTVSGYGEFDMEVPGADKEDVRATFIQWLTGDEESGPWRTVYVSIDGQKSDLTFHVSFVAGFKI